MCPDIHFLFQSSFFWYYGSIISFNCMVLFPSMLYQPGFGCLFLKSYLLVLLYSCLLEAFRLVDVGSVTLTRNFIMQLLVVWLKFSYFTFVKFHLIVFLLLNAERILYLLIVTDSSYFILYPYYIWNDKGYFFSWLISW